jgi:hypothetical protein
MPRDRPDEGAPARPLRRRSASTVFRPAPSSSETEATWYISTPLASLCRDALQFFSSNCGVPTVIGGTGSRRDSPDADPNMSSVGS